MATELPQAEFERVLQGLALDSATLNHPVDATFVPDRAGSVHDPSLNSLPMLSLGENGTAAPELSLQGLLGEGGRGEVRLARQQSLRRLVAVKNLKGGQAPQLTQEMLREARITGNLEHPNIVPVYALGRDAHDRVILVMRKVDGVPWGKLLREQGPAQTDAALERNLEIFRQVCFAIEFAHSQGIVHRDLKPDNVMIGPFGEVVVLDWGLAASLEGDPTRDLPPLKSLRGLAGTPSYMSPELVSGEGARVGKFTDVYLLGSTLHEIITGAPPHSGVDLTDVLEKAFHSAPQTYDASVPAELASICRKAMAAEPSDRYASVAELRLAVAGFLRHRQSAFLAEEAVRKLESLNARISQDAQPHTVLAQALFGFEQALRTWPENPVALGGQRRARESEVSLELAHGNLAGAERALAALDSPPAELVAKVEELRKEMAASKAELAALRERERENDPELTNGTRNAILFATALVWFILPTVVGYGQNQGWFTVKSTAGLWGEVVFAGTVVVASYFGRKQMHVNRIGRRLSMTMVLVVCFSCLVRLCALWANISVAAGFPFELLMYSCVAAVAATFVDLRFAWAAVAYGLGALLAALAPKELVFYVVGVANLLALAPTALLWDRFGRFGCEELGGTGGKVV
ncbi:MAG: serine/threonine protein kinase [Deltaproteobacteria bacterium]|nr:serine/threonine protein kinase [Deltaproteobacteria bacterium]